MRRRVTQICKFHSSRFGAEKNEKGGGKSLYFSYKNTAPPSSADHKSQIVSHTKHTDIFTEIFTRSLFCTMTKWKIHAANLRCNFPRGGRPLAIRWCLFNHKAKKQILLQPNLSLKAKCNFGRKYDILFKHFFFFFMLIDVGKNALHL